VCGWAADEGAIWYVNLSKSRRRIQARGSLSRGLIVTRPFVSLILTFAASIVVSSVPAAADVAGGEQLARRWCANCHVVDRAGAASVQQGPPSFRSTGLTTDQLRAFLTHPHGAMPDFALTRSEIDDLIGYIETLR
jgi:mono/diheme cytochrome c family protein